MNATRLSDVNDRGDVGALMVRRAEQGMVLVISLLMLLVVTVLGLAAISGTTLQNRMAANQYDRQLAFQAASSALKIATQKIVDDPGLVARNCQIDAVQCQANPFDDQNLDSADIHTVSTTDYTPSGALLGTPQYVIENMGQWINPTANTGFNQTANSSQYGAQGKSSTATYYRVTVRSADPKDVGDRAIVTLQAVVMRG